MKKSELMESVKNRIDETDVDEQVDAVIEPAFEYAYRYEVGKLDKKIAVAEVYPVDGVAYLPSDLMSIEDIDPVLLDTERVVGKALLTSRTDTFTIIYDKLRDLPGDNDELDIDYPLQYLIILYCCIAYYSYRKRDTVVLMYQNEYNSKRAEYMSSFDDNTDEGTRDVYVVGGEE